MLEYEIARKIYNEMKEKSASQSEDFQEFFQDFLQSAADYAATRTSWSFMDLTTRGEQDSGRSRKHDAFISMLSAAGRNLDMPDIDKIMPDRKTKGDFACYISLFLALEQR